MGIKRKLLAAASAALLSAVVAAPAMMVLAPVSAAAAKGSIGQKVGKPLSEAQKLAEQKKFNEAIVKAKEADAIADKSAYEQFVIKDYLTYLYSQVRDYGNAANAAEAALNTGQADAGDVARRVKLIAQLNYQVKNYAKSISFGERYLKDYGADAQIAELVTQAYYVQKNYSKSLSMSLDLAKGARNAGRTPSESLLLLGLSSAYNLKNDAQSKEFLFQLAESYSKPEYWNDLITIMLSQVGNTERTNLEIFRVKDAAGYLTDPEDIVEVSQTALQLGLPGEAERILKKGFDAGILGVGPNASREKRLQTLAKTTAATDRAELAGQKKAVALTATGQDDVKVGEAAETYGDYAGALALVQGGLAKTGVKNPDEARITLGRIQLKLDDKAGARATFAAVKTDAKMIEVARLWTALSRK